MTVNAIQCPKCKDIIYSRCRHDFNHCSCKNTAIDGGFDYMKIMCAYGVTDVHVIHVDVYADKHELAEDWNYGKNKFGRIKKGEKYFDVDSKEIKINN